MPKTDIHPTWFDNATVMCDGKPLCTVGSTKKKLQADIWLANHPFYNTSSALIDTEGRVERFMKKIWFKFNKLINNYLSIIFKIYANYSAISSFKTNTN